MCQKRNVKSSVIFKTNNFRFVMKYTNLIQMVAFYIISSVYYFREERH